jgi:alkaline phosphatase D
MDRRINKVYKNKILQIIVGLALLVIIACVSSKPIELGTERMGEFAPDEAFLEGDEHPYYGSENAWDRRFFYEHNERFYKRRGQRQMLDIVEGRLDDAVSYCRDLIVADSSDLESMFNLAVALAHQNKADAAVATAKLAVEGGLPFQRFIAGPREILAPLTDLEAFKTFASGFDFKITHGPMLGQVTDSGASFWVRTSQASEVQVLASKMADMSNPVHSNIVASSASSDFTAIVSLTELEANQDYYYQLTVDGEAATEIGTFTFTTNPTADFKGQLKIAFGGGAGYVPENEHMWTTIKSNDPRAFLFMGDNVYINIPDHPNGIHRYTYYRRQSQPFFRDLVSSTAAYAIWDDHDACTDDVWMGPYTDKPSWKMEHLNVFKRNWINPQYGSQIYPAVWHSFKMGDIEVFMLDGRFYRTNPFKEEKTMLGPDQLAWLTDALKNSTATFKVIASPVPWAYETKLTAKDTWNGFHDERDKIFGSLTENGVEGVVLISADRHRSDAWKIDRENDYSLYEFSSSRLTNQHLHPIVEGSLFGYNELPSFGMLSFDTSLDDPTITYDVININNEKIHSLTLTKSELENK